MTEDIEKRLQALEVGAQFDANQQEVHKIQREHLEQLRAIRNALMTMTEEGTGGSPQQDEESTTTKAKIGNSKHWEALRAENAMLQAKVEKQAYRIQHLVSTVEQFLTPAGTTTANVSSSI